MKWLKLPPPFGSETLSYIVQCSKGKRQAKYVATIKLLTGQRCQAADSTWNTDLSEVNTLQKVKTEPL